MNPLLELYKKELSERAIYITIRAGKEYVNHRHLGNYQEVGLFKQINALEEDCSTALHETLHSLNWKYKSEWLKRFSNIPISAEDIATLTRAIWRLDNYHKLAQNLMLCWTCNQHTNEPLFAVLDELIAQSSNGAAWWKKMPPQLPSVMEKFCGLNFYLFLVDDIFEETYYPKWNKKLKGFE